MDNTFPVPKDGYNTFAANAKTVNFGGGGGGGRGEGGIGPIVTYSFDFCFESGS